MPCQKVQGVCFFFRFGVAHQRAASVRVVDQRRVVLAPLLQQPTVLPVALPLWHLFGLRLVVVGPEALALAGGNGADFVRPCVAVGTMQLDSLHARVGRDAAVV